MTRAVLVGGPLHGQTRTFSEDRLPWEIRATREHPTTMIVLPQRVDCPISLDDLQPHRYELRWYLGFGEWPPRGPAPTRQPAYLCMDKPGLYSKPPVDETQAYWWHVADDLWFRAEEDAQPPCVVPGCPDKGRMVFTAAEPGRLAGRDWQYGDEIRTCPRHGSDIYRAQCARGWDQIPGWLRADATWDWIDTLGSRDPSRDVDLLARTARMLRLKISGR